MRIRQHPGIQLAVMLSGALACGSSTPPPALGPTPTEAAEARELWAVVLDRERGVYVRPTAGGKPAAARLLLLRDRTSAAAGQTRRWLRATKRRGQINGTCQATAIASCLARPDVVVLRLRTPAIDAETARVDVEVYWSEPGCAVMPGRTRYTFARAEGTWTLQRVDALEMIGYACTGLRGRMPLELFEQAV